MTADDQKFLAFGRMVFGMITDVLVLPSGDQAYARRTVTLPDGLGGKHSIALIAARPGVADVMERGVAAQFNVEDIKAGGPQ